VSEFINKPCAPQHNKLVDIDNLVYIVWSTRCRTAARSWKL